MSVHLLRRLATAGEDQGISKLACPAFDGVGSSVLVSGQHFLQNRAVDVVQADQIFYGNLAWA